MCCALTNLSSLAKFDWLTSIIFSSLGYPWVIFFLKCLKVLTFLLHILGGERGEGRKRKCGGSSYSVETELAKSSTVGWLSFCKGGQISFCEIIGGRV